MMIWPQPYSSHPYAVGGRGGSFGDSFEDEGAIRLLAPKSASSFQTSRTRLSKPLPPLPRSESSIVETTVNFLDQSQSAQSGRGRHRVHPIIPKAELARQLELSQSTQLLASNGPVPPRRSPSTRALVSTVSRSTERTFNSGRSGATASSTKGAGTRSLRTTTTEVYGSDIIRPSQGRKFRDRMCVWHAQQKPVSYNRSSSVAEPVVPNEETRKQSEQSNRMSSDSPISWQSDIIDEYALRIIPPLGVRSAQARLLEGWPIPPTAFLPPLRLPEKVSTDTPNFSQIGESTLDRLATEVLAGFVVSGRDGKLRGRPVGLVRGPRLPPPSQRQYFSG